MLPIQNLNGYDHPWAGGAGKNLLDPTGASATKAGSTVAYDQNTGETTISVVGITYGGAKYPNNIFSAGTTITFSINVTEFSATQARLAIRNIRDNLVTAATTVTGTGRFSVTETPQEDSYVTVFATYTTESDASITYTEAQIEVGAAATAYEPYSNVCPIYGHTSASAYRTGKNLLENIGVASSNARGVIFTKSSDGSVTANGTNDGTGYSEYSIDISLPAGNYYFTVGSLPNGSATTVNASIWCVTDARRARKWDGTTQVDSAWLDELYEVQIEDGKSYYMILYVRTNAVADNVVFKPMICASTETDPTFEPYNGDTYTVSFGQTIYGGTLNLTTGVLTATAVGVSFDGTESWSVPTPNTNPFFRIAVDGACATGISSFDNKMCSHFATATISSQTSVLGYGAYTSSQSPEKAWLQFRPDSSIASTVEEWKAYLAAQYAAGTPVQCTYPLATPQTYQLTPQEITTLLGTNNIWVTTATNEP